jgi:Asp-tRNA(Asn)/Glu-tRNA(Gln) amidotransferase A subunit family amidase
LPVGVQLIGKPADEITIISLAAQLESRFSEHKKRPDFALI